MINEIIADICIITDRLQNYLISTKEWCRKRSCWDLSGSLPQGYRKTDQCGKIEGDRFDSKQG